MDHARDALTLAYKAKQILYPKVMTNLDIRRVFRVVLVVLGNEEQGVKSWDDIRDVVEEAVDAHFPHTQYVISPAVKRVLLDVVDDAQRFSPVYISPPPYS